MVSTQYKKGFGLIELMVSISIMLLVMSVIITRQGSFNGATILRGETYEVALLVREIQSLAVSAAFLDSSDDYRGVVGIYFMTTPGNQNLYRVFKDADGDNFYDAGEEYGPQGILDKRFVIDQIRLMNGGVSVPPNPATIAVVFQRPNFDAKIYEAANNSVDDSVTGVEIDIRVKGVAGDGPGAVRTVEITKTGQISVKNAP